MRYLESLQSLLGVSLVGLMHQLSHLLRTACLTLLVHWIYPAPHTPTHIHMGIHRIKLRQVDKVFERNFESKQLSGTLLEKC